MATIINGSDNFNTNDVVTDTELNTAVSSIEDSGWITPTFENGWTHYPSPFGDVRYRKINGVVHIEGIMKDGTISNTLPAFTLPVGFRPKARLLRATQSDSVLGRLDVDTNGYVIPYSGSNAWFSVWCSFVAHN